MALSTAVYQSDGPAPLTRHRKPLPALTGVRFIAAMQVVLFHFGAAFALRHSSTRLLGNFLANGWIAVSFFFILSGFILTYTYAGQIGAPGGKWRFWEARFARIYPTYLLSLLLMLPFQKDLTLPAAATVLTMIQTWNPAHPEFAGAWNLPAWTLSIEAFFYLVFPFLLLPLQRIPIRPLKALLAATLGLTIIAHTLTHTIDILSNHSFIPMPLFRLPEFFLGMNLGLLFLRLEDTPRRSRRVYAALFLTIAVLVVARGPWLSLSAIPYAALIYELASSDSRVARLLGSRAFVLLGGASYAVYLLQLPVRYWLHFAITGHRNQLEDLFWVDAILTPVVLVGFSIIAFLYWEEPAKSWLRSWFKRNLAVGASTRRHTNET